MILRESETRFVLSFTSGGAANAEMWVRDWIDTWGLRVHVLDRTMSLAAINVTGPLAGALLRPRRPRRPAALPGPRPRRGRRRPVPRHAPVVHRRGRVRAPPPDRSLGRAVARADGRSAPTSASGRTGSRRCSGCGSRRATSSSAWTPSSTPPRGGSGWTGRCGWTSRGSSAGRRSSGRPSSPTSVAGSASRWTARPRSRVRRSGRAARSSATSPGAGTSPLLGRALMLGWLRRRRSRTASRSTAARPSSPPTPFYDPEGHRARA